MRFDLHTHTTASDGQYCPSDMIDKATKAGLAYYAITDHDTIGGIEEAIRKVEQDKPSSFRFLPGIEISTQDAVEIHVVGLGIDHRSPALVAACERFKADRDARGVRICDYLGKLGVDIEYESVKRLAGESNLGRPHFAAYLLQNGYVSDKREAFRRYLDTPEFHAAVDRILPKPEESIALIHAAGGVAILAHPGIYDLSEDSLEDLIVRVKKLGMDGIECYYSKHSEEQTQRYLRYAEKYDMIVSGGSDFHGERVKPDVTLGMEIDGELDPALLQGAVYPR